MLRPTQVVFVLISALTLEFSTSAPGTPVEIAPDAAEPEAAPHRAS